MTFSLTITDVPGTGLYSWELRDQGRFAAGQAPTVNRCLTEVPRARLLIKNHVHRIHSHTPTATLNLNPGPHPASIPQVHPPGGHQLPTQQHVPPPESVHTDSAIRYDHRPSESG